MVDLKTVRRLSLATLLTGAGHELENSTAIGQSFVEQRPLRQTCVLPKLLLKGFFFKIQAHQMYLVNRKLST